MMSSIDDHLKLGQLVVEGGLMDPPVHVETILSKVQEAYNMYRKIHQLNGDKYPPELYMFAFAYVKDYYRGLRKEKNEQ